jgi:hypothetical protein
MIVTIEEDTETGELMLPFPPELLASLGWVEGDTLVWTIHDNGNVSIMKKE